jgi:hypothetical protein
MPLDRNRAARLAGLRSHHIETQREAIIKAITEAKPGTLGIRISEQKPMRWAAALHMIEGGELVVIRESRGPTRRGPAREDGTRAIRRELLVTLDGWDPMKRQFEDDQI